MGEDSDEGITKRRKVDRNDEQTSIETKTDYVNLWPNQYKGVSTFAKNTNNNIVIDRIPIYALNQQNDAQKEKFSEQFIWNHCISRRQPCVIDGIPDDGNNQPIRLDKETLLRVAGNELVQVERRFHTSETFGQSRNSRGGSTSVEERQLEMTIQDFCKALQQEEHDVDQPKAAGSFIYLSTQEAKNYDGEDYHNLPTTTITTPCRQLMDNQVIPQKLSWAGNLILQSCNLWMGTTKRCNSTDGGKSFTSSGLHHDFHDNFYLLLHGTKSFRLFSPDCAGFMDMYGEIHCIYPNGLISYVGRETLANGQPMIVAASIDQNHQGQSTQPLDHGCEESFEDDAAALHGDTVFDQMCDEDSDDDVSFNGRARDDYDDFCGQQSSDDDTAEGESKRDNFSRIDLRGRSLEELTDKENGEFASVNEIVVHLQAGQTLYLPAGWFHEVSSKSSSESNYHMALNYWFHPPDNLKDFNHPYKKIHDFLSTPKH